MNQKMVNTFAFYEMKMLNSEKSLQTNRPKIDDFFPTQGLNFDITTSQMKRFYGKVKKIGQLWVTPDGAAFPKQHLAYKNVHESYAGKELLPLLVVPEEASITEYFDLHLPSIIRESYVAEPCEPRLPVPASASMTLLLGV